MTILEDIKAGRLVVVPREATQAMNNAGSYCQRSESGLADEIYTAMLTASPDHTKALLSMVEGMEKKNEALLSLRGKDCADYVKMAKNAIDNLTRALAAEAKVEALREALAPFGSGAVVFYENEPDDCVLSLGRWKYQEDGRARFYADVQFTVADVRRARALTEASK